MHDYVSHKKTWEEVNSIILRSEDKDDVSSLYLTIISCVGCLNALSNQVYTIWSCLDQGAKHILLEVFYQNCFILFFVLPKFSFL
jgi:hypothetical protein